MFVNGLLSSEDVHHTWYIDIHVKTKKSYVFSCRAVFFFKCKHPTGNKLIVAFIGYPRVSG